MSSRISPPKRIGTFSELTAGSTRPNGIPAGPNGYPYSPGGGAKNPGFGGKNGGSEIIAGSTNEFTAGISTIGRGGIAVRRGAAPIPEPTGETVETVETVETGETVETAVEAEKEVENDSKNRTGWFPCCFSSFSSFSSFSGFSDSTVSLAGAQSCSTGISTPFVTSVGVSSNKIRADFVCSPV